MINLMQYLKVFTICLSNALSTVDKRMTFGNINVHKLGNWSIGGAQHVINGL